MLPPYSRAAAAFARTIVPSGASASIGSGLYSKIERKRSSLASSDAVASTNALMSLAVVTTPTMRSPTRIGAVDVVTGNVEPSVRCMRSDSLTVSPSSTRLNDDRPIQPLSSAIRSPYARPTSVDAGAPNVRCAAALACVTIPGGSISSIASPALVNTERKRCSFCSARRARAHDVGDVVDERHDLERPVDRDARAEPAAVHHAAVLGDVAVLRHVRGRRTGLHRAADLRDRPTSPR